MTTKFKGAPVALNGKFAQVGDKAKDFTLVKGDLSEWQLGERRGSLVLNIYPSVDTGICALSTKRFNKEASNLKDVEIVCISKDLPFAQQRFAGAEGIDKLEMLSAFRNPNFGRDYGVEIAVGPFTSIFARAVVIIKDGIVTYTELVPEITQEPNYEAALAALQ